MAPPDKKKIQVELQKALSKSQSAKAVELYRTLIELEPDDFKLHNSLGDVLVRLNKTDEAITEFKTAAAKFAADGFVAQAMAVYQKCLKIKEDADVRLGMADIQAGQGLAAEAKKNYLQVLEKYMQAKLSRKAIDVMQKLADLDPGNVDLRIKLARVCEGEGLTSKAIEEYRKAGRALLDRKETGKALSCFQKVVDALPDDMESKVDLQKAIYLSGKFREAKDGFAVLRKLDPKNTEILLWEGKAAYRLEDYPEAESIFTKTLELAPDRIDTHKLLIRVYRKTQNGEKAAQSVRLLVDQMVAEKNYAPAIAVIRETLEDFPGNSRMLSILVTVAKLAGDREVQKASLLGLLEVAEKDGDRRLAAGALNDLCVLDPENADYQRRLRNYRGYEPPVKLSHEEVGLVEEMEELELLSEEAELEVVEPAPEITTERPQVVERRVEPAAGRAPRPSKTFAAPKAPELTREQQEQIREAHTEVDVYLKYGLRESAVEALAKILSMNPADEKALEGIIGLTLGIGKRDEALAHIVSLGLLRLSRGQTDLAARSLEEGMRIRKDDPGLDFLEERIASIRSGAEAPARPAPAAAARPPKEEAPVAAYELDLGAGEAIEEITQPLVLEEEEEGAPDLEEADFYYRQGLLSDALPIYRAYLAVHPGDAQVSERIEEIEKKSGKAPAPVSPPVAPVGEVSEEEVAVEDLSGYEEALAEAEAEAEIEIGEEAPEEVAEVVAEEQVEEAPTGFSGELGGISAEEMLEEVAAEVLPEPEEAGAAPPESVVEEAEPALAAEASSGPAGVGLTAERGSGTQEFFDLAAELDEEISQLEEAKGANLDEAPAEDLESVFREFQEGVVASIGDEDADTHYNLGIAYKEMGLFAEAISEFGISIRSPDHSWDSAVMMGICHRENGDHQRAIEAFTKALLISDRSDDEYIGLRYELAQVYEKAGKLGEALVLYREIQSRHKGFADVGDRIGRLESLEEPEGPGPAPRANGAGPHQVVPDEPVIAAPKAGVDAGPEKEETRKPKKNRVSYL